MTCSYNSKISLKDIFKYNYGGFIIEAEENIDEIYLGKIISEKYILYKKEKIDLKKLSLIYENKLEKIYSCNIKTDKKPIKNFSYETKNRIVSKIKIAKPKVIIPVLSFILYVTSYVSFITSWTCFFTIVNSKLAFNSSLS